MHEIVFQKVLAHAFVQLPHQAQECFVEDLPVLQAGIFLTSPKEHCLQMVGCDNRPLPWTPDILLHLPHGLKTSPAAAPVLIQLLQQHLLCLQEAQLPVVTGTGQQGKPERLRGDRSQLHLQPVSGTRGGPDSEGSLLCLLQAAVSWLPGQS